MKEQNTNLPQTLFKPTQHEFETQFSVEHSFLQSVVPTLHQICALCCYLALLIVIIFIYLLTHFVLTTALSAMCVYLSLHLAFALVVITQKHSTKLCDAEPYLTSSRKGKLTIGSDMNRDVILKQGNTVRVPVADACVCNILSIPANKQTHSESALWGNFVLVQIN